MKLTLDGKEIAEFDPQTRVLKQPSKESTNEPKKETITVPLVDFKRPSEREEEIEEGAPSGEVKPDDETVEFEALPKSVQEFFMAQIANQEGLNSEVRALNARLDAIMEARSDKTQEQIANEIDEIGDVPEDKDPFGIARTIKKIAKKIAEIDVRTQRTDQHGRFIEARRVLDEAKMTPNAKAVFSDPKVGPIAERLLTAELNTARGVPIADIVNKVVKEVAVLRPDLTKKKIGDKLDKTSKVPPVIRTADGATPAVTVDRPRNLKQASDAYAAFRRARDRFTREGR